MQIFHNTRAVGAAPARTSSGRHPRDFHRLLDGYAPSPLIEVPSLAAELGLGGVLIKHEAQRYGLPSFKIIGASWATYRALSERLGREPVGTTLAALRIEFATLGRLTLATATDGNHGRAVARAAAWFGMDAHIYVPHDTAAARIAGIESEGAIVTVVDADYDEAVRVAAATESATRVVISDTSWPGYTDVPRWISEGYSTIFEEIDEQLAALGRPKPDAFIVPVGVGAFALAALDHWPEGPPDGPVRIAVEPTAADCLYRSMVAGEPVTVPGPHLSMMAGMNCGTLSMIAWPTMRDRFDWCVTIGDDAAAAAMRRLAAEGLVVGETGAASVGLLLALGDESPTTLQTMGLGSDSTVVCLATESATDPANFETVVGATPDAVAARRG